MKDDERWVLKADSRRPALDRNERGEYRDKEWPRVVIVIARRYQCRK